MDYLALFNSILSFIIALYGEPSFPRKIVDIIFEFISRFVVDTFCKSLENSIFRIIDNAESKQELKYKIRECINLHCNVFENFSTEKKRFQLLKNKGLQEPEPFGIRKTFTEIIRENKTVFVESSVFGYCLPLTHSLKYFLEIPGLALIIINNVKKLSVESNVICNVMQGKFWKKNVINDAINTYILPLFVYYDDIEVGNALGSHSGTNKFGVTYVSIACLPANIASLLDSIIFSTIVRSEDMKQCTNVSIFRKLITELNFLRDTGITITVDNVLTVFKFQTVLIVGDNLGLNAIYGMVESFKANCYCRICTADSFECSQFCTENKKLLRTQGNYCSDVMRGKTNETGLKEQCVFNQLRNYHFVVNKSVDFMHDVLEGVCIYVIRAILNDLIFESKLFTLEYLNLRIKEFVSYSDDTNQPPPIALNRLKGKLNLKFSAAEMLYLTRYLGVIIGDKIPRDNEHWKMYIYLRKIVDILMSPRIVDAHVTTLTKLIEKLNSLYLHFYKALKPKFHFLTHYPAIIDSFGPCVHYWTMRYESRHREVKANAVTSNSNINLLKTIALKQALKMCKTFDTFENKCHAVLFQPNDCRSNDLYSKVTVNGSEYKIGSFIVVSVEEPDFRFGEIIEIKKLLSTYETKDGVDKTESKVQFTVVIYEETYFDNHFMVYVVEKTGENKIVNCDNIPSMPPVVALKKNQNHCIIPRYIL
ncbi:uncharacterized protein LOC116738689 [Nasonia vitripennis]|uniref:Uncharacterized protein n=1 Tax=Nasonia vitripennis TaxID=7425 RepID=A0A7M7R4G8_NASVI|nr:uncharacterized protein LOC116738689 [Nasonia vitripennis]